MLRLPPTAFIFALSLLAACADQGVKYTSNLKPLSSEQKQAVRRTLREVAEPVAYSRSGSRGAKARFDRADAASVSDPSFSPTELDLLESACEMSFRADDWDGHPQNLAGRPVQMRAGIKDNRSSWTSPSTSSSAARPRMRSAARSIFRPSTSSSARTSRPTSTFGDTRSRGRARSTRKALRAKSRSRPRARSSPRRTARSETTSTSRSPLPRRAPRAAPWWGSSFPITRPSFGSRSKTRSFAISSTTRRSTSAKRRASWARSAKRRPRNAGPSGGDPRTLRRPSK